MRAEKFSGPLPHPQAFAEYERVLAGAADRILKMAEQQSTHRQDCEKRLIGIESRNSTMGVVFAFILGAMGISGGIYLTRAGFPTEGLTSIITSLAVLSGAFIYGQHERRKVEQKKPEQREPEKPNFPIADD